MLRRVRGGRKGLTLEFRDSSAGVVSITQQCVNREHQYQRIDLTASVHFRMGEVENQGEEEQYQSEIHPQSGILSPHPAKADERKNRQCRTHQDIRRVKRFSGQILFVKAPESGPNISKAPYCSDRKP